MGESNQVDYNIVPCIKPKKSEVDGPCIMKIQNGNTIINIPDGRKIEHIRDLASLSLWRSLKDTSVLSEGDFTKLENNLKNCEPLTKESFAMLELLIGDDAVTTGSVVNEENKKILTNCDLLSPDELTKLEELLKTEYGGKRKSRKSRKSKSRKSKKSRKTKSRKSKKSKSHKK